MDWNSDPRAPFLVRYPALKKGFLKDFSAAIDADVFRERQKDRRHRLGVVVVATALMAGMVWDSASVGLTVGALVFTALAGLLMQSERHRLDDEVSRTEIKSKTPFASYLRWQLTAHHALLLNAELPVAEATSKPSARL